MIEARDLVKSYGKRRVLAVERLAFPEGMLSLIVGPNGAGKSTLLRILALVERPDRGAIWIGGKRVRFYNRHRLRRKIGWLMQQPLMLRGSVLENVEAGLRFQGVPARARRKLALSALERVGFGGEPSRSAASLSGGEQKLVALARLLVLEPKILLLDEPLVHLDRRHRERLLELLLEEAASGKTVVVSEHQKSPAFEGALRFSLERGELSAESATWPAGADRRAAPG